MDEVVVELLHDVAGVTRGCGKAVGHERADVVGGGLAGMRDTEALVEEARVRRDEHESVVVLGGECALSCSAPMMWWAWEASKATVKALMKVPMRSKSLVS